MSPEALGDSSTLFTGNLPPAERFGSARSNAKPGNRIPALVTTSLPDRRNGIPAPRE